MLSEIHVSLLYVFANMTDFKKRSFDSCDNFTETGLEGITIP